MLEERSADGCAAASSSPARDQTSYTDTPLILGLEAGTVGGTVTAVHGEDVFDELVGVSEGVPGQRFALLRKPVVASERPVVVEVAGPEGWEPWEQVQGFGESGPDDPHWRLNANEGAIIFGPAVRLEDGSLRQYGAVPPAGAHIRVRRYRTGAVGSATSPPTRSSRCKSAIPFVGRVDNRRPAVGGVDGETLARGQDARSARARHAEPGGDRP